MRLRGPFLDAFRSAFEGSELAGTVPFTVRLSAVRWMHDTVVKTGGIAKRN
jgi:hypothetical protein